MSELLEKILDHKNLTQACREICANGTMIEECDGAGREDWEALKDQLRQRSYTPKTNPHAVTDRIIQQGIAQILSPVCAPAFSENCYGHCPGKSREMAVRELLPHGNVSINTGLQPGEAIATSGLRFLSDGMKVKIQ